MKFERKWKFRKFEIKKWKLLVTSHNLDLILILVISLCLVISIWCYFWRRKKDLPGGQSDSWKYSDLRPPDLRMISEMRSDLKLDMR